MMIGFYEGSAACFTHVLVVAFSNAAGLLIFQVLTFVYHIFLPHRLLWVNSIAEETIRMWQISQFTRLL